ncbi:MAG: HAMP domain-containing histidine kinase [Alphaproteobacteria bacterium]|nr:HAMP domain-containing histidine kinase [Alphaproteobacteria bacterium]MBT5860093.1 HAMP domain-containing histidine kinase [Alphaproteobacteria bacterium]
MINSDGDDAEELEAQVYIERVGQSYQHALGNRVRTLVVEIVIGVMFWFVGVAVPILAGWAVFALAANGALVVLETRFRATTLNDQNVRRWALYRVIFAGIAASPYGIAIFLLPANSGVIPELLLFIILSTTVSVSSIGFSVLPSLYLTVNAMTMGLLTVGFLTKPDPLHLALAALSVIWQVALLRKAWQVSQTSIEGIRTNERLRREIAQHEATKSQLTDLNRQKDQAFQIIGHDLLGPFTILQTYSEMLKTSADKFSREKIAELSDNLNQATEGSLRLVQNLLNWSRAQMHRVEVAAEALSIDELVAGSIQELEFFAREKEISLGFHPSELTALADPALCKTVMRNLISNAIKFTDTSGEISISSNDDGEFVSIKISDNGVGMSPEQIGALFDLGEKTTTTGTRGEQGTGLGLIVCKEFVDIQGGEMSVVSTPGNGCTVSVSLPKYEGRL